MSEEKGKGISLRKSKKRSDKTKKGGPPVISAPRQISAPMPAGLGAATLSSAGGRPSNESNRSGQRQEASRPRERPQRPGQDKTADLVKRRILQALTAVTLIREAHAVQKGDWVLVTAAAGGVGLWLCQLLRAVGARTIAAASSAEKREFAQQNGAEFVVGYHEDAREKFTEEVVGLTPGGEGVSVVFDSVGAATFDASLACVARKGSMVSFGNASGPVVGFALGRLAAKNVKLVRPTLFNYVHTREELQQHAAELWRFIEADGLNVRIHDVYPLKDVVRATNDIEGRGTMGKLLLRP